MSAGASGAHSRTVDRKTVPYMAVIALATLLAAITWVFAFRNQPTAYPVSCGLGSAGNPVASTALVGEAAVAPRDVRIRVYNANGHVGQAATVAEQLRTLSFIPDEQTPFGNDPLVPSQNLGCFGQLRFGEDFNGHAAALHAVFPCFELIHDARIDPSVDISLGEGFGSLDVNSQLEEAVAALNQGDQAALQRLSSLQTTTCS